MTKKARLLGAAFASVVLSTFFASAALAVAPTYTISLDKTAAPATLPAGGGAVTYTFVVSNTGTGDLQSVDISDDKCSPVTFDTSSDGTDPSNPGDKLKSGESWTYTCDATLTATTTNTATAEACHSSANCDASEKHGTSATDSATVTVGTNTATIDTTGTSAAMLALVLLAIGGLGFLGTTNRLPRLPKFR